MLRRIPDEPKVLSPRRKLYGISSMDWAASCSTLRRKDSCWVAEGSERVAGSILR